MPNWFARVYEVVARVPAGRVVTYGQVARYLGMPRGARTVGWAMRHCPAGVPWHRVIGHEGAISSGGNPLRPIEQRHLLQAEGISFDAAGHIDLKAFGWDGI